MAKIIAIANQKGGVGKTTTSVNLSACVAAAGKRVLLLDTDPQGNATSGLGLNKSAIQRSVYDVFINEVSIPDVVQNTMIDTLKIVPSHIQLASMTISSSIARRRSVCSRSTRSMPRIRCSCRFNANSMRSRAFHSS